MKSKYIHIISLLLIIFHTSCDQPRLNFDKGIIPLFPQNMEEFNSEYDDYNSAGTISSAGESITLNFSSNRATDGQEFDFYSYKCYITSSLIDGSFIISGWPEMCELMDAVNSNSNEFGPYFTFDVQAEDYIPLDDTITKKQSRFFFTSDREGPLNIYCIYYTLFGIQYKADGLPFPLQFLNSGFDDGYICIHEGVDPDRETVYFTSNRLNNFDIFRASSEEGVLIEESDTLVIVKMDILSSEADDKCPFILNNMMVFVSDREGGYGGFDLWYSTFNGIEWSKPLNFGAAINTEYDEYRPIIIESSKISCLNDFIIFSSNRPGGKGGFDLYACGLKLTSDYFSGEYESSMK